MSGLVSVCMPAYNAARWIEEAVESVLAQTYENFELVISDNCSDDGTAALAGAYRDPRIRVVRTSSLLGAVENHNRSVQLSRGEYVKFLHADDRLLPECLEENVALAREQREVGLVFSPRRVLMEMDDDEWLREYTRPHEGFEGLERVNGGRGLFEQLLRQEFELNLVGEPSAAFVTRSCLAEVGLFNPRLLQIADLELWARIMLVRDVGFVERELAEYRHHEGSVTTENTRFHHDWLDRLWLFESLLRQERIGPYRRQLEALRARALRRALRAQAGRVVRRRFDLQLLGYASCRLRLPGRRGPLYPSLAEPLPA